VSKHNRKGRSKTEGHFVADYEWMLACPAYRSLSLAARCILHELKRFYNGRNNGDLFLSVRHAAELLSIGKSTAQRAFAELEDRKFIRPAQKSGFDWKTRERHATTWILTEYQFGNLPPTKDFLKWSADPSQVQAVPPQVQTVPSEGQPTQWGRDLSSSPDRFEQFDEPSVPATGHI
jgi:hypothetical protein